MDTERDESEVRILTLAPNVGSTFDTIEPVLGGYFGPKGYRLGGGAVLQALWAHRRSTDLDFFIERSHFRSRRLAVGKPIEEVLNERPEASEADGDDGERGAQAHWQGTPVEFITLERPLRLAGQRMTVTTTTVETEWPAEILARKLKDRIWRRGVVTIRDVFDIGTAKTADPDALKQAMETLRQNELDEVAAYLRSLGPDWTDDEQAGEKPLLDWIIPGGMPAVLGEWPQAVAEIMEAGLATPGTPSRETEGKPNG